MTVVAVLIIVVVVVSLPSVQTFSLPLLWTKHAVDVTGANEYVRAHYGGNKPYFEEIGPLVPIYNARGGILSSKNVLQQPRLEECGFCLHQVAAERSIEWTSKLQIRKEYLPKLRQILQSAFDDELQHIVFWHPMLRMEQRVRDEVGDDTQESSPIAPLVHIDTDVGAFGLDDLMRLIDKNRVMEETNVDIRNVQCAIESGCRFAIVNAWRNIRKEPVQRSPLALLQQDHPFACFPQPIVASRWYTFPDMTRKEILLFKQYDRRLDQPSDIWHCALAGAGRPDAAPRASFDVRAFCIFSSRVPSHLDRYAEDRPKAVLSLKESECFCESQAKERKTEA